MESGVTIIICTYNGKKKLPATLDYILRLKSDFPWELIVVDNASTDGTFEFANEYLQKSTISFKVLSHAEPGKMFAFWHAVRNSRYSYILDCDDDNYLFEDYLMIGHAILTSNSAIGVLGGYGIPKTEVELPDWFANFSRSYALGPQNNEAGKLSGKNKALYGAGCYYRRQALDELVNMGFRSILSCRKGANLSSGGDTELCLAIQKLGLELWYSDLLKFYHAIEKERLSWAYYLKMKAGTASSFPLLHAYLFLNYPREIKFKYFLWKSLWYTIKGYLISGVKLLFIRDKQTELDYHVCKSKVRAFVRNYPLTIMNYQRLNLIFDKKWNI